MKVFSYKILLTAFVTLFSCTRDQEPIFHLFEHSRYYPDYDEIAFLRHKNLAETQNGDTLFLSGENSGLKLRFTIYRDEIVEKRVTMILEEFDTLLATKAIENQFGGKKTTHWTNNFYQQESVYSTFVEYRDDFFVVTLDSMSGSNLLETRTDFVHRVIRN
jgi:hypothetical protein